MSNRLPNFGDDQGRTGSSKRAPVQQCRNWRKSAISANNLYKIEFSIDMDPRPQARSQRGDWDGSSPLTKVLSVPPLKTVVLANFTVLDTVPLWRFLML